MTKIITKETLLKSLQSYVDKSKTGNPEFVLTFNDLNGLVNKIGKVYTLDTDFTDKLKEFNAGRLPYGTTVEEWYEDLILPNDYDKEGTGALTASYPSYRKPCYSYELPRKKFKTTVSWNLYNSSALDAEDVAEFVNKPITKLNSSSTSYLYGAKRQLIANLITACLEAMGTATSFDTNTQYKTGTYLKNGSVVGVVMFDIPASSAKSWDDRVNDGEISIIDLVSNVAKPVDTTTGEDFFIQLKKDLEIAGDENGGHNLNGNYIGKTPKLIMYIKQGIIPITDVKTLAGAYHLDKIAPNLEIKSLVDFGNANADTFAILMDSRTCMCFEDYLAYRDQTNGDGDFVNYFKHTKYTMAYSRNTFVKVYKDVKASA